MNLIVENLDRLVTIDEHLSVRAKSEVLYELTLASASNPSVSDPVANAVRVYNSLYESGIVKEVAN